MNVKIMLICARLNSQDRNTNFYENIPRIFFKICEFKISEFFVSRRLFLQSHNCINQMGTYTCDCNAGYEISKKGRDTACQGYF